MLIDFNRLPIKTPVKGVLHIGAHECEEKNGYNYYFRLNDNKIIWIEALKEKVDFIKNSNKNILIYNECIFDVDDKPISFMVSNNYQSSSILNFKTHLEKHPSVYEINRINMTTKTLETFYRENSLNPSDYNFMNLDIQGVELMALKGAGDILNNFDYIYTEVNTDELYEGCCRMNEIDDYLEKYGFKRIVTEMTTCGWGDAFYVKN